MAGRLKQMRDPDVVKLRPYWQYIHAESRVPQTPRPLHLGWDGLVLDWDDPWWDVYFPPNDWRCSCGVRTLSRRQLEALGKSGPDVAPPITRKPYLHQASGQSVLQPEGTGFGWDYMPGDHWERGLVPSALLNAADGVTAPGRQRVQIDTPAPIADLLSAARPFTAERLPEGLRPEDYVMGFLRPFGATLERAVLWEDPAGMRIPISAGYFQTRAGLWKVEKRGRATLTPLMAEALREPDEIWMGLVERDGQLVLDRRYIRVDPGSGLLVVLEMGRTWWEPITIYMPTKRNGQPDLQLLANRRGGKLIWSR